MIDIEGNELEIGDIVLRPICGTLAKHYVLGFSRGGRGLIVSCEKKQSTWSNRNHIYTATGAALEGHNNKQYLSYPPTMFIYKKNAGIPENLIKFVKK